MLPRKLFDKFAAIQDLILDGNLLYELPAEMSMFCNLKKLSVSHNNVTNIPEAFSRLSSLVELDFSNNKLSSVPENLFCKMVKLRKLKLGNNSQDLILDMDSFTGNTIAEIPISIGNCTRLEKLDLRFLKIRLLPDDLGKCTNMQSLNVSCNRIEKFPLWLPTFFQLKKLQLQENRIRHIPSTIAQMTSLEVLIIHCNKFSRCPLSIAYLPRIREFMVDESALVPSTKKHTVILDNLTDYLSTVRSCVSYRSRVCIVGDPQSGKTSLFKALNSSVSSSSTVASASTSSALPSPNELEGSPVLTSDWNPSSSIKDTKSGRSAARVAPSPDGSLPARFTFILHDFNQTVIQKKLYHLLIPDPSFLSSFLLTFNVSEVEHEESIRRWITGLRALYPSANIILVGTHRDGSVSEKYAEARSAHLEKTFDLHCVMVSSKTGKMIKQLIDWITNSVTDLSKCGTVSPARFSLLEESVMGDAAYFDDSPIMSWAMWTQYCQSCKCSSPEEITEATNYLSDCGIIVHLRGDTGSQIDDLVVFSKRWLIERCLKAPLSTAFNVMRSDLDEEEDMTQWNEMPASVRRCLSDTVTIYQEKLLHISV